MAKTKTKTKAKAKRVKNPDDEMIPLTRGQIKNIVNACDHPRSCCPTAKKFVNELRAEMKKQ